MKTNFNHDWKYYLGDLEPRRTTDGWGGAKAKAYGFGAAALSLDDSRWRSVTLPHDFVSEGEYSRRREEKNNMTKIPEMESIDSRLFAGGSLEGGVAWYRKHFSLQVKEGQRVLLHFDGIYRDSVLYVNEYFVKRHASGYTSFVADITDFVNLKGENLIAVRVDATGREGWWYEGGGIYRNVWLEVKEAVYLEPWGIHIIAEPDVENHTAVLKIETEVTNRELTEEESKTFRVIHRIYGETQEPVQEPIKTELCLENWKTGKSVVQTELHQVVLWDLEHPYQYKAVTFLYQGDFLLDREETYFGIRSMKFDAEKGFFLNGKHVRITGLCCHQDHAGVGIASYRDIWEYRLKQMKSMGMNAYRTAHHMASPEVLELCDKLGILVMGETRRMSSAEEDREALRTLIKRDRNHPSIFLWSIGNEEIFSQHQPETVRTTITLKKEVQQLDATRPVTSAVVCWDGKERFATAEKYEKVTEHLDVMGFNYCRTAWEIYHQSRPQQPILITEASANSSTRGCYETREEAGQYYIFDPDNEKKCVSGKKARKKDVAEEEWKYFAERPYLSGIFLWTGMDYRGEPTPLSYPSVYSHFGIFDYCGFEKDNYYYYKSWWQETPVLHLFPHWNHTGKEGMPITVYGYSNLEEVELLVNGKSYGRKRMPDNWYLSWENVIYEPGQLTAKGYRDGREVLTQVVETTGKAYRLSVMPVKKVVSAESGTAIFQICVLDEEGREVPTENSRLYLSIDGEGELLGTGNGNPGDHDSEKQLVRCAFHGKMQVLVRPVKEGQITLRAEAEGMYGSEAVVQCR